jgi:hypothetical protein
MVLSKRPERNADRLGDLFRITVVEGLNRF